MRLRLIQLQLVPGILSLQREKREFRFAQFAAASCPPVLEVKVPSRLHCDEINNFVLQRIKEIKPDVVVIAGYWLIYQVEPQRWHFDPTELANTVRLVQAAGAKRVVLMGQVPTWKIAQPKIMVELFLKTNSIPERTTLHLEPKSFAINETLRPAIVDAGATYILPSEYLCSQAGCLIQIRSEPAYFDTDHLTPMGSDLLLRHILGRLLERK